MRSSRLSFALAPIDGVLAQNAKLRPLVVPQGPEVQAQATEVVVTNECDVETV